MHIRPLIPAPDKNLMPVPTLAVALLAIDGWTDLTSSRRDLLKASLLSIADMLGDAPALIILSPQFMRARLLTRSGSSFGIPESTIKNLRSHLRQAMGRMDTIDTCDLPTSPAWEVLLTPLDSREKAALAKLRDYCVMTEIEPEGVSDEMIRDFAVWLEMRTLTAKPKKVLGSCRRAWNRFSATHPGWPATTLTVSSDTHQYILPLDQFTVPFREDLARFGSRLSGELDGDLFTDADEVAGRAQNKKSGGADDAGDRLKQPLREISVNVRLGHARWAASALVACAGARIGDVKALVDLVRPRSRAGDILRFIYDLRGKTASAATMHVYELLKMVMKYEAKSPPADITWLRGMRKLVTPDYSTMSVRRRRRIENVLTPERQQLLLQLPHACMKQALELLPDAPREATSLAMRAVAIQILLTTQLRLKNVIEMKIGQHLQSNDPANDR